MTDTQCIRCGGVFPQSAYPPNRASVTGYSLACGGCLSSLRTGPVETAIDLIRRSFTGNSRSEEITQ